MTNRTRKGPISIGDAALRLLRRIEAQRETSSDGSVNASDELKEPEAAPERRQAPGNASDREDAGDHAARERAGSAMGMGSERPGFGSCVFSFEDGNAGRSDTGNIANIDRAGSRSPATPRDFHCGGHSTHRHFFRVRISWIVVFDTPNFSASTLCENVPCNDRI
jgi:hypothetical protein